MAALKLMVVERILLIEDDPEVLETLERLLRSHGFEVMAVKSGFEAIEKAQEAEFALVIADVRMPGIDGIETLGRLSLYQPQARKVVITGYAGDDAPVRAIRISADDYLMKPFGHEIFLKSVENALARYRFEKEKGEIVSRASDLTDTFARSVVAGVERRFPSLRGRGERLAHLAGAVGEAMDLGEDQIGKLRLAARCHDLGYVAMMEEEPSDSERHALEASEIISSLPGYEKAAVILRHHHEPLLESSPESGILGLCEEYDRWVTRMNLSQEEAIRSLGRRFEPALIGALSAAVLHREKKAVAGHAAARACETLLHLAQMYASIGETELAKAALSRIEDHPLAMKDSPLRFRYLLARAQLLIRAGKLAEGCQEAEKALEMALSLNLGPLSVGRIFLEMSLAKLLLASREQLEEMLRKVEEIFARHGDWRTSARTTLYLGLYALLFGEKSKAGPLLSRCREQVPDEQLEEWLQSESAAFSLLPDEHRRLFLAKAYPEVAAMKIFCLGPFRVYRNGSLIPEDEWKGKKPKLLIVYLLLNMERPVPEERLCDLFWPESDPDRARKNLHNTIYHLRRVLEPALSDGAQSRYVLSQKGGYQFNRHASFWLDVAELKKRHQEAELCFSSGQSPKSISLLSGVESLYQGEFLEEFPEATWCLTEREKLREIFLKSLLRLAAHHEKEGRLAQALDLTTRVLAEDSLQEQAATQQIRLLFKAGKRSEAVRRYHEWCALLKQELNLSPPPELLSVYLSMTESAAPRES